MRAIIVLYIFLGIIALIVLLLHFSVRACVKVNGEGFTLKVKYLFFTLYQIPEKPDKKPKKPKKPKRIKKKKNKTTSDTPLTVEEIDNLKAQLDEIDEKTDDDAEIIKEIPKTKPKPLTKAEIKELKKKQKEEKKRLKTEKKRIKAEEKANKPSLKDKINNLKRKWLKIKPYVPTTWKAVKKLLKTIRFRNTAIQLGFGKEDPYESAMNYGKMNIAVFDTLALLGNVFTMHYKHVEVRCLFNEKKLEYDVETTVCVRPSTVIAIAFCTLVNYLRIFLSQRHKAKKTYKAKIKEQKIKLKNKEKEGVENE